MKAERPGPTLTLQLSRNQALILGTLAMTGACGGMIADVYSLWVPEPERFLQPGHSVSLALMHLLAEKTSVDLWWGSLLGIVALPFHICGFFLTTILLKNAGKHLAAVFFALAVFMAAVGAGFHGSIALVGEIARAGDPDLFLTVMKLFGPWWWILTLGFTLVSGLLLRAMGSSTYPRWARWVSPLPLGMAGTAIAGLLLVMNVPPAVIWLLAIWGLNLPLLIFHGVTTIVMLRPQADPPSSSLRL
jgi:hypothetical protein